MQPRQCVAHFIGRHLPQLARMRDGIRRCPDGTLVGLSLPGQLRVFTNRRVLHLHHQCLESRVPAFGRQRLADQLRQRLGKKRPDGNRRRHLKLLLPDANGLDRKGQGRIRAACRGHARIRRQGRHAVPARRGVQGGQKKGVGVLQFGFRLLPRVRVEHRMPAEATPRACGLPMIPA
ncbi:hypothetical protein [Variovorax sp. DXTD-1]|uniref:hypothetical protein n=1 Tax=Variovorax sp. DXTD-1 TaxID=2495592 RepID=UPI0021AFAAAC|nr:hypothetical protein [Variovorax sp. DXTD-1]